MKSFALLTAFIAAIFVAPANAAPTVITFDQTTGFQTIFSSNTLIQTEAGFTATSGSSSQLDFTGNTNLCGPSCPDNGTRFFLSQTSPGNESLVIQQVGGGSFSFTGFDGAEAHSGFTSLWAQSIVAVGYFVGGGTISQSFALDFIDDGNGPLVDWQTFSAMGFNNLSKLAFYGTAGSGGVAYFTVDNITLNGSSSVPAPAALVLLGFGLLGLGGLRRKQKAA